MLSISLNHQRSVEVSTGEVKVASAGIALTASALGSCIAVVACAPKQRIGGIAHVMLPGRSRDADTKDRYRYAGDAIDRLLAMMSEHGASHSDISLCLAGGANVLRRDDDVICDMNITSVCGILSAKALPVAARCLGGVLRRRVAFDIAQGSLFCAVGDAAYRLLHTWHGTSVPPAQTEPWCRNCATRAGNDS